MIFNSIDFLVFFPIVVLVYYLFPIRFRYFWLLIASYYFYMVQGPKYAIWIIITTFTTWICGLMQVKANHNAQRKKWLVFGGIFINLVILLLFKYGNFIIENINIVLEKMDGTHRVSQLNLFMPIGISFYTFKALAYVIDVYRGKIEPEKNFLKYALFVSFFPQLMAGPIERGESLLKQIEELSSPITPPKKINIDKIASGLLLMLWGLFQKMVIADRVALLVNTVFDSYYMYGTFELLVGAVGYAIQIYCDFASYSTIAIGASEVLGFETMENFNTPYFSSTIKNFWARWHISLSTWFRDYLYIPLGGNRKGKLRTYINMMMVFLASGLWHGANWTFILWGGLHGLYQIIGAALRPIKERVCEKYKIKVQSFSYKLGRVVINFWLVDFAWIFFRSNSISDAYKFIRRLLTKWNPWALFDGSIYKIGLNSLEIHVLAFSLILLFLIDLLKFRIQVDIVEFAKNQCFYFQWLMVIVLFTGIIVFGVYGPDFDASNFIYSQF